MIVVRYGGGTHTQNLDQMKTAVNWVIVDEAFYLVTTIFLKLSLGVFFLRICIKKWQKYLIYGIMGFNTFINIFHIFFITFMCGSPGNFFMNALEGKCVSNRTILGVAYEQGVVTTSTDWIYAILPVTILWHAQMDRRTKSVCAFVLSLGAFGSICSLVRFKYINGLSVSPDFFWNAANISIWSTVELGMGIVACSLATLRPLFKKLFYSARHRISSVAGHTKRYSQAFIQRRGMTKRGTYPSHSDSFTSGESPTPWDNPTKSGAVGSHLASCYGGDEMQEDSVYREEKKVHLIHVMKGQSIPDNIWSTDPEKAAIWPYDDGVGKPGPGEISKVVDVEVAVLRHVDSSKESLSGASSKYSTDEKSMSSSPESHRELIKKPEKAARKSGEKRVVVRSVASTEALTNWRGSWLDIDVEDQRPATQSGPRNSR